MKKMSKKLTVAILSVAFAFVALGATTFAWFTLTNEVTISQFNAQVTTGSGFEVSVDDGINGLSGGNYYTNLPYANIAQALTNVGVNNDFRFNHITSKDGYNFKNIFNNGEVYSLNETWKDSDNDNTQDAGSAADRGYIQFDLKFRSLDKDVLVYLGATTLSSAAKSWTSDVTFTNAKGEEIKPDSGAFDYYIHDAARISFTGTIDASQTTVVELPEETKAIVDGGNRHYGNSLITLTDGNPNLNGAGSYYNAKFYSGAVSGSILDKWVIGDADVNTTKTNAIGTNSVSVVKLSTQGSGDYYYGTVTVRVWIEGWDPDCFDAVLLQTLNINIQFSKE